MKFRGILDRLKRLERKILPPAYPLILSFRHGEPIPDDLHPRTLVVIGADLDAPDDISIDNPARLNPSPPQGAKTPIHPVK